MRPSLKVTLGYKFWVGFFILPQIDTFVGEMYVCFKPMINWDKLKEEAWFEDGAVRFGFDCDASSESICTVKSVCLIII